jgi:hypothetical protein
MRYVFYVLNGICTHALKFATAGLLSTGTLTKGWASMQLREVHKLSLGMAMDDLAWTADSACLPCAPDLLFAPIHPLAMLS